MKMADVSPERVLVRLQLGFRGTFPADIWCQNYVVSTSMRRHYVASKLILRHFTSCARWADINFELGSTDAHKNSTPTAYVSRILLGKVQNISVVKLGFNVPCTNTYVRPTETEPRSNPFHSGNP